LFSSNLKPYLAICIPAILYLVNSFMYMAALGLTTPSFLHIAMLAKIPITAIMHHFIVRRQTSAYAWASLAFITVGMLVFNLPADFLAMITGTRPSGLEERDESSSTAGLFIGLIIALVSGFTSTYTEVILKRKIPFWVAQTWLYAFGSLASGVVYIFWDGFSRSTTDGPVSLVHSVVLHIALVVASAGTGLVIANILRKQNNLVKIVGTSAGIVVIIFAQFLLFRSLRATTLNMHTAAGVAIIAISTWTYNHYKQTNNSPQGGEMAVEEEKVLISDQEDLTVAEV
jgi:solute carrier family 35 (UDP-sugar transporter), member A1/2/3